MIVFKKLPFNSLIWLPLLFVFYLITSGYAKDQNKIAQDFVELEGMKEWILSRLEGARSDETGSQIFIVYSNLGSACGHPEVLREVQINYSDNSPILLLTPDHQPHDIINMSKLLKIHLKSDVLPDKYEEAISGLAKKYDRKFINGIVIHFDNKKGDLNGYYAGTDDDLNVILSRIYRKNL